MALEEALNANTAAVNRLADMMAKGSGAVAAAPEGAKKGPGRPRKVAFEEVKAIAKKVMDEKGRPVAVKLIQQHGADQLANIEESKYAAFVAAAEVLLSAEPAAEAEAGDEL